MDMRLLVDVGLRKGVKWSTAVKITLMMAHVLLAAQQLPGTFGLLLIAKV
jgi:hypothetical protein